MLFFIEVNDRFTNCGAYIINIMIHDPNVDLKQY